MDIIRINIGSLALGLRPQDMAHQLMPGRQATETHVCHRTMLTLQEPATSTAAIQEAVESIPSQPEQRPPEQEAEPRLPFLNGQPQQQQQIEPQQMRYQVQSKCSARVHP